MQHSRCYQAFAWLKASCTRTHLTNAHMPERLHTYLRAMMMAQASRYRFERVCRGKKKGFEYLVSVEKGNGTGSGNNKG